MAVAASLLMLTVAADQSVAKLALVEPAVSTEAANGNNNTTPPPPPPGEPASPPDEPQRPVDPGSIIQGGNNSSIAKDQASEHQDVVLRRAGNVTTYDTAYGGFRVNDS